MATYTSNTSNQWTLYVDVTNVQVDTPNNRSKVSWSVKLKDVNRAISARCVYHLTIDGTTVWVSGTYGTDIVDMTMNNTTTLASGTTGWISHNSDGSKSVAISAGIKSNESTAAWRIPQLSLSGTLTLTTIARASSFTLSGATQTNADINVAISRKASTFTHRVRWRVGSGSWTTASSSAGTSASFKVQPSNMANLKSATITVGVQTYSGSTAIGSEATATRTITIPNTTISLSGTASTGSTQTVSISNSGGSLTYTRSWSLGNATGGDSNTWVPPHSAISTSGTLTCTVVTKNGTATINTVSATRTITVPSASSFTLSGATQTNANINVSISKTWSSFNHRVRWRMSGSASWNTVQASSWTGTSTSFKVQPSDIPNSKSKEIEVGVQTYSGSTTIRSEVILKRTVTIPNSTISLSGTAVTDNPQTVSISNSGGSLTYTRSWSLGNATGGNVASWTPPHSALSGAASGTLTCTVVTKNGTATINTASATRTISAPGASSFTLSGATQTNADINVAISRSSTDITHRVRYKVGSGSWINVTSSATTSASFKVQPSNMPNLKSATITVGVQAYSDSGTTPIRSEMTSTRTITIPNTTITLSGTANTGSTQTVKISNSGGSLTHTKSWKLGSATGGDSLTWTPPHSALPNATSGTLTCTVVTKNGTATVNTVSATRTISVPTGEQPTFTAITHTEAVTNVATLVGAYVQGHTRLKLGVTEATAATGSSIKSYSISVAGHTVGNGETTPVINQSGTLTISATVTDNRNRSVTKTATIEVLPYENPTVTGVTFTRSNADGTANTSGTHLTIKATVRVRQLVVEGIEKNKIWYQAESAQVGYDYETKKNLENEAGSSNGNYRESVYTHTLSGYPVDYPYNIRARGGDIFSWSGYIAGGIPTGLVLQHWGEDTTSFGKMIDDVNYNVLVGAKGLKSDGPIIDKDGKDVSKPSWSDVSSKPAQATRWPAWSEVTSKPSTFAPSSHTHAWSEVTSKPTTATRWPAWSEVTGKPSTFAPSSHTHAWSQVTSKPTTATRWPAWSEVTGKPSVFNSDAIQIPDTRSVVSVPQNLALKAVTAEFKNNSSVGNPPVNASATYSHIINVAGWSDGSGGWPSQISVGAGGLAVRQATSATAWGAWKDVSKPTWSDVSSKPAQATRWPTWSEVTSKPTTATRWPTWAEVTGKPSTFTSVTRLYSGTLGANSSATISSISGYTFLIVVMHLGVSTGRNRDNMIIPVTNISYSTAGDDFGRISYGAVLRWMNFSFGSATNIRTGPASEIWIKTIYGVK